MTGFGVFTGGGEPMTRTFEAWVGKPVSHVLDFFARDDPTWWANRWRNSGRTLVLSLGLPVGYTLEAAAKGQYNAYFRRCGQILRDRGRSGSVMRPLWEGNGRFYSWGFAGREVLYQSAFRHIVTEYRAAGCDFRYDWCLLAGNAVGDPVKAYPGDDFVDYFGMDAYDTSRLIGSTGAARWNDQVSRPFGLKFHDDFAAAHGLQRSHPEWGVTVRPNDRLGGGDNPYYIAHMLPRAATMGYACYFDKDAKDAAHKVSPVSRFPKAAAAFLAGT